MWKKENPYYDKQKAVAKDCQSKARCKKCHQKHITAICDQKNEPSSNENKPASSERTLITATSTEKVPMLLQTARASLVGTDREKRVGGNVLFNGRGQKEGLRNREVEEQASIENRRKRDNRLEHVCFR